jgi:hypothetical protein
LTFATITYRNRFTHFGYRKYLNVKEHEQRDDRTSNTSDATGVKIENFVFTAKLEVRGIEPLTCRQTSGDRSHSFAKQLEVTGIEPVASCLQSTRSPS